MSNGVLTQIALEMWGAIFCVIFLIFLGLNPGKKSRNDHLLTNLIFHFAVLLFCDCVAWMTRGKSGTGAAIAVRLSNFLVFILNYALGLLILRHVEELLAQKGKRVSKVLKYSLIGVCVLGSVLVIVSQFTGLLYTIGPDNVYVRSPYNWTIWVVAGVMLLLLVACVVTNFRDLPRGQAESYLAFSTLTGWAAVTQFLIYGVSLVNISMTVGIVFLFIAYERDRMIVAANRETAIIAGQLQLAQKEAQLAQKEAQITRQQTQIVLSQMQPHFLYNALSAISILCKRDPEKAKLAVDNLADYLRTNLDSLRSERLVSFTRELEHTNAYLTIEKLRFGDDLHIACNIRWGNFMLPSLTLQPLVENAVRHGLCGKEEGGTVTICTDRTESEYLISVIDDGVGFDLREKPRDGRSHVGLENVRQRLRLLCGGSLTIHSVPGVGTKAVIHIPIRSDSVPTGEEEK